AINGTKNKGCVGSCLRAILNQEYKSLDILPGPLQPIVKRCLDPEPDQRYSALELVYALMGAALQLEMTPEDVSHSTLPMRAKGLRLSILRDGYTPKAQRQLASLEHVLNIYDHVKGLAKLQFPALSAAADYWRLRWQKDP
ncbi:MAG: hypothetical protein KJ922_04075, partial [Nanoarchaeota archaeon]|nr:hypothetical protein [Nanoarchaeota archaeon]